MTALLSWLGEHTLVLLLAVATAAGYIWLYKLNNRLKIDRITALLASVLHTACGVLCVKVFAVAETGFDMSNAGNMSLFGGVFFMPLYYFLFAKLTKRKVADVFDVFTVCIIFTLMCARINCLISGCCFGLPIKGTTLYWPTRELEIVFYVVLLIWLGGRILKTKAPGAAYPLYMIAYGVFRFIIEWFRQSSYSGIHPAHIWSLISLALGLSIYFEFTAKKNKLGKERRK